MCLLMSMERWEGVFVDVHGKVGRCVCRGWTDLVAPHWSRTRDPMLMRNDVKLGLSTPHWPWKCMNELLVPHIKGVTLWDLPVPGPAMATLLKDCIYADLYNYIHETVERYMFKPPISFVFVIMGSKSSKKHWSKQHVRKERLPSHFCLCISKQTCSDAQQ